MENEEIDVLGIDENSENEGSSQPKKSRCSFTIKKVFLFVRRMRNAKQFNHIYGADETALWLDTRGSKAEKIGAKDVIIFLMNIFNSKF